MSECLNNRLCVGEALWMLARPMGLCTSKVDIYWSWPVITKRLQANFNIHKLFRNSQPKCISFYELFRYKYSLHIYWSWTVICGPVGICTSTCTWQSITLNGYFVQIKMRQYKLPQFASLDIRCPHFTTKIAMHFFLFRY